MSCGFSQPVFNGTADHDKSICNIEIKKKKNAGLQIRRRWWVARVLPQGANASWEQDSAKYNFKIIAENSSTLD